MSEHNESPKEVIFEVENRCRKDPGSTNSTKQRKHMFNTFLEQNLPNTPRAPPHISTLYVHPLYLNHDLSNFVGSEINFDTKLLFQCTLLSVIYPSGKGLVMILGGEKNKLKY